MSKIVDRQVVVIGAGLAGLSTAVCLLEKGVKPLVLEAKDYVGGRTASWDMRGMEVESGLHRVLGFYTHFPKLLKTAGLELSEIVDWEDEVEIRLPDGPAAVMAASMIHKPFKTLATSLGNNHFLSFADKMMIVRFLAAGLRDYALRSEYLDSITALDYAKARGLNDKIIARFLIPVTEGIFFLKPDIYSAYALFGLMGPYWKSLIKMRIGAFAGGMSQVLANPLAGYIKEAGGEVLSGQEVTKIDTKVDKKSHFSVHTKSGEYSAEAVVLAASLFPAQQIIRTSFKDKWFEPMLSLQSFPSVTFQLELKRPSLPVDRTTFGPTTYLSAFAEQSRTTFKNSRGRLSIILSPPHSFIHMDEDDILGSVVSEAKRLGMELEDKIISYRKVVEPHDFYLLAPGAERLRPQPKTPVKGLFLAGDYTKQKYLATMEGAVFSGERAAKLVLDYLK